MLLNTGEYAKVNRHTGLPFLVTRGEVCPSTHGGAGYVAGDYFREDGKIVCCLCGAILNPREGAIGPHVLRGR